jgi:hypothetical protein
MLILTYDAEDGEAVPDGRVASWLSKAITDSLVSYPNNWRMTFSTENVLEEVRTQIAGLRLTAEDVELRFEDKVVEINAYGNPVYWPKGFCDFSFERLRIRANAQVVRRQAEQKEKEVHQHGN